MSANKAMLDYKLKKYPEAQRAYDKIKATEPLITKDLQRMSDHSYFYLEGLQYSVKEASHTEEKIERKIAEGYKDPNMIVGKMGDIVRYTAICQHEAIPGCTKDIMNELSKEGYVVFACDNKYIKPHPKTGYKGIHLDVLSPTGTQFELQVHSRESFQAKTLGHALYEDIRKVDSNITKEEWDKKEEKIREIHGSVKNPEKIEEVKSFSKDPDIERQKLPESKIGTMWKRENGEETLESAISLDGKEVCRGAEVHLPNGNTIVAQTFEDSRSIEEKAVLFDLEGEESVLHEKRINIPQYFGKDILEGSLETEFLTIDDAIVKLR